MVAIGTRRTANTLNSEGQTIMKKDLKKDDMTEANMESYIRKIPFLACLHDTEISEFKRIIVKKQFVKDASILHEENTSNYFYFIMKGKVKIVQLSAGGKEKILAIHKKGDFFGEMAILDGKTAPATVIAMEDTLIGLISRDMFDQHLLTNNRVLREMIILLCGRLRDAWSMMRVMSFADAEHRVKAVLEGMAEQFGIHGPGGTLIDIKLTHSDIGNFASLARETATRMMNRLEKAQEIEIIHHKYILLKPAFYKKNDIL